MRKGKGEKRETYYLLHIKIFYYNWLQGLWKYQERANSDGLLDSWDDKE